MLLRAFKREVRALATARLHPEGAEMFCHNLVRPRLKVLGFCTATACLRGSPVRSRAKRFAVAGA
eukprot:11501204-Alexandrium_andersonii.AAC.1